MKRFCLSKDGAVDTDVKLSNDGACHIDFDAGPGRRDGMCDVHLSIAFLASRSALADFCSDMSCVK